MKPRVFILGLCLLSLLSCERRELTDDQHEGVSVMIDIDWSCLRAYCDEKQHHIKALFYPEGGGKPIERHLMNPNGEQVRVPEGNYHIIVYNWRTNAEAQTIQFRGIDNYFTHEAYTAELSRSKQGTTRTKPIIAQPDYLYAWTTGEDLRQITFKGSEHIVIKAKLESLIHFYHFTVDIYNPDEIRSIESAIEGTHCWVRLASGKCSGGNHSTDVTIKRLNESNGGDGRKTEKAQFLLRLWTFGALDELSNKISIESINPDGLKETHFTKCISDIINKIDNGIIDNTDPYDISDPQSPITITPGKGDGGFKPPTVGNWVPEHGGNIDV